MMVETVDELLQNAIAHQKAGEFGAAERLYLQILSHQPSHIDALLNLGVLSCQLQKFAVGIDYFQKVLEIAPDWIDIHANLGLAYRAIGNLDAASRHYRRVVSLDCDRCDIHYALGQILAQQGRSEEAIDLYQKAIALQPDFTQAYLSLSSILIDGQQLDTARNCLQRLIAQQPDCSDAYWNLCAILRQTDDFALWRQTAQQYRQHCQHTDRIGATVALMQAYYKTGMHAEALELLAELELWIYEDAEVLCDRDIERIYFLVLFAIFRLRDNLAANSRLAKLVGQLYARKASKSLDVIPSEPPQSANPFGRDLNLPDSERQLDRLRIGFMSANFQRHPVGWCSADVIQALTNLTPHIYLFATKQFKEDDRTRLFERIGAKCNWQRQNWQLEQSAETLKSLHDLITEIEQADLDVLIDLDSLTANRHPEILLRKPASMCISWLGFDAPFLSPLNYNLGDRHTHPSGIEQYYVETILRLPDAHMAVAGFPSIAVDRKTQRKSLKLRVKDIVYLCVTPSIKLNRSTVEAHVRILKSVPKSILLYKGRGDLEVVEFLYRQACLAQDIDNKRIKFLPLTDTEEEHRSLYVAADILLDSYPYNGGSHTLEALWFDLPVITRVGEQSFARMGYSFLTALGISDGIAHSWDEYVEWGIHLGQNKGLRDAIREKLIASKQVETLSPLWNPSKLAADMYDLFIEILEGQRDRDPATPHFELGNSLWQQGKMAEAASHYRQAIALQPDRAEAWGNLGTVLHREQKLDEAIAHYQKSLLLNPHNFVLQSNLAKAFKELGNIDAAIACYEKAIAIDPHNLNPYNRLGEIYFSRRDWEKARIYFQQAIAIDPSYAFSQSRLGSIYLECRQVERAIEHFRKAIASDPNYANAHVNLSLALLLAGEYQEGFVEYEWRWQTQDIIDLPSTLVQSQKDRTWYGDRFSGQTLLIYAEQGLGDFFQFIRYLPLVRSRQGDRSKILVTCPASIKPLLSHVQHLVKDIDLIELNHPLPEFDICIPLLSLPRIFGTTVASIPNTIPYLFARNDRSVSLGLSATDRPRIGVVWATCSESSDISKRSCPLELFRQLVDPARATFYSLQKEIPPTDVDLFRSLNGQIVDFSDRIQDFADTAAVIAQMDLIISVDTAVAHLAGAMGKPVWILLAFASDWRWLLEREDSPWYPTMRLFRQESMDDWIGVLNRADDALKDKRADRDIFKRLERLERFGDCNAVISERDEDELALWLRQGLAYQHQGNLIAATHRYRQILQKQPDDFNALYLLGIVVYCQENFVEALTLFRRTIALKPDHAEAHKKAGDIYYELGRTEEAISFYKAALTIKPDYVTVHLDLALTLLLYGEYQLGFKEYEWRWHYKDILNPATIFAQPLWDGTDFPGKKLLIYFEQGLGDSIQFIRYLPLLRHMGDRHSKILLFDCPASLHRLLSDFQGASIVERDLPPSIIEFDVWAPLMSLPRILGTTIETIPADIPYLFKPRDVRVELDRDLDNKNVNLKRIGVVWATRSSSSTISKRSCPLSIFQSLFANVFDDSQVRFYSFQKEIPPEEADLFNRLQDRAIDLRDRLQDFADTAAFIEQMDLIISVDTAVAHLAGAMGKPVWLLLAFSPDWRWMLEREDSPWYPTMRLFRQTQAKNWQGVIDRTVLAFRNFCYGDTVPRKDVQKDIQKDMQIYSQTKERLDPDAMLQTAIAHQQAGELIAAEQIYHQILQIQPDNFNALYLIGVVTFRQGNLTEAIGYLQRTIALKPDHAESHRKLGDIFKQQGNMDEAIASYQSAIAHRTNYPEVYYALGIVFWSQHNLTQAAYYYQQAIELKPDYALAHGNLGAVLYTQGKVMDAVDCYRRSLQLDPDNVLMLCNLGVALVDLGLEGEAIANLQSAIQTKPDHVDAFYNLGRAYQAQNNLAEAIAAYQTAISIAPNCINAHIGLGSTYASSYLLDRALDCFQTAIAIDSSSSNAHNWSGWVYLELNRPEKAIAAFRQAIVCDCNYAESHMNLGIALLMCGNFAEGLAEFEWRSKRSGLSKSSPHFFPHPLWDGKWDEKTQPELRLLVFSEQGFGDLIQFVRYLPLIGARFGQSIKIIFDCQAPLYRLFSHIGKVTDVQIVLRDNPLPPFDYRVSLLSLPHIFGTRLETIPSQVPYLSVPDEIELSAIASISEQKSSLKVGLIWASKPNHSTASKRSCPLIDLVELIDRSGAHFYVLQKEVSEGDRQILAQHTDKITDLSDRLGDFADTAAIIAQLDLVISVDTSVAHLAGAMGKPVWVLLPFAPDWRWMLEREDSPWYPTMRLFRQSEMGNWESAIHNVGIALRDLLNINRLNADKKPLKPSNPSKKLNKRGEQPPRLEASKLDLDSILQEAIAHHKAGRLTEADVLYRRILQYQPQHFDALHMLGTLVSQLGQLETGITYIQQALELNPHSAEAHSNLGCTYSQQGNLEKAIPHYQKAITLKPDYADARKNLGLALLALGNLKDGFREYEWRWQSDGFKADNPLPSFPHPVWDARDASDRTLLIYCEQGLGDAIQFSRYIPLIKTKVGKIILDCPEPLSRLFEYAFGTLDDLQIAQRNAPLPPFDIRISLMSLPHILGTSLETIPARIPYLSVPPVTNKIAADISRQEARLRVGLVWASKLGHATTAMRSCPLGFFLKLLDIPEIEFYSLQKEVSDADLEILQQNPAKLQDLRHYLGDFVDTAAIIESLDLVISIDTSVAHLAGAMGKPVWLLLPSVPDWRWMLEREDSPWYPTMRLFRQSQQGQWEEVLASAIGELYALPQLSQNNLGHIMQSQQTSLSVPPSEPQSIGIGLSVGLPTGWGVVATNLVLQLLKSQKFRPYLLVEPNFNIGFINPLFQHLLASTISEQQQLQQIISNNPNKQIYFDFPIIQILDNHILKCRQERFQGKYNFGYVVFEGSRFSSEAINNARPYDLVLTASTWNANILQNYGLTNVRLAIQGIDPTIFHPAPRSNLFGDRFVIFSGGKLEYRKGQDIVVAAFKAFQSRHPDALLLTAWHNFWPDFMVGIDLSGNVAGMPVVGSKGQLEIGNWLIRNGLPAESFIDLGLIPNHITPQIIREADVALFPNRCEGGTNLVAMECLACGVPTILSANTGHLDLLGDPANSEDGVICHCYPLHHQKTVRPHPHFSGVDGWGESDIEEIVEVLEQIYTNRAEAKLRGERGALFMQDLTWEKQVEKILAAIAPIVSA